MMINPKTPKRMISLSLKSPKRDAPSMLKCTSKQGSDFYLEANNPKKHELQASANLQNYKYILIPKTYTNDLSKDLKKMSGGVTASCRAALAHALDQQVQLLGFITFR